MACAPTWTAGAQSHRPMQGTRTTCAPGTSASSPASASAPCSAQAMPSQTAHPHAGRRRVGHLEMGIERRHLEHLGEGQPHLLRQRRQQSGRDAGMGVLDEVQKFDQQVAPPRAVAEQAPDFVEVARLDLPPLRNRPCPAPRAVAHERSPAFRGALRHRRGEPKQDSPRRQIAAGQAVRTPRRRRASRPAAARNRGPPASPAPRRARSGRTAPPHHARRTGTPGCRRHSAASNRAR